MSSNLGVVDVARSRPDGTDADYFAVKLLYPGVTKAMAHRFGGLQVFITGNSVWTRLRLRHCLSAGPPPNSNDSLRQDLSSALNDFSLTGTYIGLSAPCTIEDL